MERWFPSTEGEAWRVTNTPAVQVLSEVACYPVHSGPLSSLIREAMGRLLRRGGTWIGFEGSFATLLIHVILIMKEKTFEQTVVQKLF